MKLRHASRRNRPGRLAHLRLRNQLQASPQRLADDLPMVLAALAYSTSELRWYFSHVGEALPLPPASGAKALLPLGQAASFVVQQDVQALVLLASAARLHAQLVSGPHRPCGQLGPCRKGLQTPMAHPRAWCCMCNGEHCAKHTGLSIHLLVRPSQLRHCSALEAFLGESMRATLVQQVMRGAAAIASALDDYPAIAFAVPQLQVSGGRRGLHAHSCTTCRPQGLVLYGPRAKGPLSAMIW